MSNYEELLDRFIKLEDQFHAHLQEGAVRNALMQKLTEEVNQLRHTVYGNGKEGLVTIQARMDENIASIKECLTGLPEFVDKAINEAVVKSTLSKKEGKEEKKPLDWQELIVRNLVGYAIPVTLMIVLQALWEYAKVKLNTP